jgi:hypothetical protein
MMQEHGSGIAIQIKMHDKSQIEVSMDYQTDIASQFNIDLYFFLPSNLGIHSGSYVRDNFYNDLINHLRFHTPLSEKSFLQNFETLHRLTDEAITAQERDQFMLLAIQEIKIFANFVNTELKNARALLGHRDKTVKIETKLHDIYAKMTQLREKFVFPLVQPSLKITSEVRQTLLNTDEFISNKVMIFCSDTLLDTQSRAEMFTKLRTQVREVLQKEKKYRQSLGDLYCDLGFSEKEREYFYYRQSLLKKDILNPLQIEKASSKQEQVYRNWVAGFGAGLAALWSQLADYQTHRYNGHKDFGFSMLGLALLAIFAYIFKDRIKDLSKEYINDKLKLFLPDYKSKLVFSEVDKKGKNNKETIGFLSEYMRYIGVRYIPEEIVYMRALKSSQVLLTDRKETVIQYHKSIKLKKYENEAGYGRVKDIHRFNFSHFLDHLDDAIKELITYDDNDCATTIEAPKVYHINVISRITFATTCMFYHVRIILDKFGIVRLETVLPLLQVDTQGQLQEELT